MEEQNDDDAAAPPDDENAPPRFSKIERVLRDGFYSKVSEIIVVITAFDITTANCGDAVLADPTGKIRAVVHREIIDKYRKEFIIGTVLHLKDVSVFTLRIGVHSLIMTCRNIVRMLPPTISRNIMSTPPVETKGEEEEEDFAISSKKTPFSMSLKKRKRDEDDIDLEEKEEDESDLLLSQAPHRLFQDEHKEFPILSSRYVWKDWKRRR